MESTLALTYTNLLARVGFFLGHGRGPDSGGREWSDEEAAAIEDCVQSGLRQFYWPSPIEGQEVSYDWSFLRPTASFTFASGDSTVALPFDFGGAEGGVTVTVSSSSIPWTLSFTGEGVIRQRYAEDDTATGKPMLIAVRPVQGTTHTSGQRNELYIYPLADDDYTLSFTYYVNPNALTKQFPYHMGGTQHAETIVESCLAIAEQLVDDMMGVHTAKFKERLLASINADRKLKPQHLGYNGDRSDMRDVRLGRKHGWPSIVTFDGVEY